MKTFVEFLKEQAESSKDSQVRIERKRQEWVESVRGFIDQAVMWLKENDRETKVLKLAVDEEHMISEEELGVYNIPRLRILLGNRDVEVLPVARNVVGGIDEGGIHVRAQGRLDITNRSEKYIVYRIKNGIEPDKWKIIDPDQSTVRDLDRSSFEEAVQSLLE